jgi:hypothetical protein
MGNYCCNYSDNKDPHSLDPNAKKPEKLDPNLNELLKNAELNQDKIVKI